jgi:hypothetical protein
MFDWYVIGITIAISSLSMVSVGLIIASPWLMCAGSLGLLVGLGSIMASGDI